MVLSDLSIQRPVLATVMSLTVVLLGIMAYERLPVREYPNIDTPVVSVRTAYRGASSEVIESQVTTPLEDALAGIEGIETIKSVSREEVSQITLSFELERDPDAAAADVRDRVSRTRGVLPQEADESVIAKVEADAQAILWLALASDRHSALEITDYADRYVKDRLQSLAGVASIIIGASAATRCASGSNAPGSPPMGSLLKTSRTRCGRATSRSRAGASRAGNANSRS